MPEPLSRPQLLDLVGAMRAAFQYLASLRRQIPVAEFIQYPKITPFLTESLAFHLIRDGVILPGMRTVRLGGRSESDVVCSDPRGRSLAVEVKGTGNSAWVFLSDKDYSADHLLWILFGRYFENEAQANVKLCLTHLSSMPERRQRITIQTLSDLIPKSLTWTDIDLNRFLRDPAKPK